MNSSSHSNVDFVNKIDQLVHGCLITSSDILLQGRRASFVPKANNIISEYSSNSDFCAKSLNFWKNDLTMPLCFDISILQDESRKLLMERWKFNYLRRNDLKEGRISSIKKRIVTFLRTLYSFIRLLPGYQVLKFISQTPNLMFELSSVENPPISPSQLESDTWKTYEFPPISTTKGILSVAVNYIDSVALQKVFNFNANISSFSPVTFKDPYKSKAANPIPIQQQQYSGVVNDNTIHIQESFSSTKMISHSPLLNNAVDATPSSRSTNNNNNNGTNIFDNFQPSSQNSNSNISPYLREQYTKSDQSPRLSTPIIQSTAVLSSKNLNSFDQLNQSSLKVSPTTNAFIHHRNGHDGIGGKEYGSSSLSPTPYDDNKYMYGDSSQKNIYATNLTGVSPPFPPPQQQQQLNSDMLRMSNSIIETFPIQSNDYLPFLEQKSSLPLSPFDLISKSNHFSITSCGANHNKEEQPDNNDDDIGNNEMAYNNDTQQTFEFDNEDNDKNELQPQQSEENQDTINTSSDKIAAMMDSNEIQSKSQFMQQLNMFAAISGYATFPVVQTFEQPKQSISTTDFVTDVDSQLQEFENFRSIFMSN